MTTGGKPPQGVPAPAPGTISLPPPLSFLEGGREKQGAFLEGRREKQGAFLVPSSTSSRGGEREREKRERERERKKGKEEGKKTGTLSSLLSNLFSLSRWFLPSILPSRISSHLPAFLQSLVLPFFRHLLSFHSILLPSLSFLHLLLSFLPSLQHRMLPELSNNLKVEGIMEG